MPTPRETDARQHEVTEPDDRQVETRTPVAHVVVPEVASVAGKVAALPTPTAGVDGTLPTDEAATGRVVAVAALTTPNVVLDTQTLYGENFKYDSRRLRELAARVAAGDLQVRMVDINEQEVRAGIRKRVGEATDALSGKVRKAARILSNLPGEYALLFDAEAQHDIFQRLEAQFDEFLRTLEVEIISSRTLPLGPLFDRYFHARPPFEATGDKKAEFPDAASVQAVIAWTAARDADTYLVSGDKGVRQAASECARIHPVESLDDLLAMATFTFADQHVMKRARAAYDRVHSDLAERVGDAFTALEFAWRDYDYGEPAVESVDLHSVALSPALLIDLDNSVAHFQLEAAVFYLAHLRYDDPTAVYYDREDGETRVFNRIHAEAEARIIVPVSVFVAFDLFSDLAETMDVTVNDDREILVVPDQIVEISSDRDEEWLGTWDEEHDAFRSEGAAERQAEETSDPDGGSDF